MRCRVRSRRIGVLLSASLAWAAWLPSEASAFGDEELAKWYPWLELGGYYSDELSRGEGALFAPLWQSRKALLFTELRGKAFEQDAQEGNFALGLRVMRPSGWNLGVWGGWDVRHTERDSTFHQGSFGLEALSANFDLRANGYLGTDRSHVATVVSTGVATSESRAASTSVQPGVLQTDVLTVTTSRTTTTTTARVFEHALNGFDGEIGFRVPLERWFAARSSDGNGIPRHELRLYGGGFWFDDDDDVDEVAGPRARAELRFNDIFARLPGSRLSFETEYQYDDVRDHQIETGARLRISFGGRPAGSRPLTAQERRMTERLERDTDIVSTTEGETSTSSSTTTTTSTSTTVTVLEEPEMPEELDLEPN